MDIQATMEEENLTAAGLASPGIPDIALDFTFLPIAIRSFLFFSVIVLTVSPVVSWQLSLTYRRMTPYQKCDWNSRCVSLFHALTVSAMGMYNTLFDKPTWDDPIWGYSYWPRVTVAITTGYIISDLGVMLMGFPLDESVNYIIHHLAVALAYVANVFYGPLTYFANVRILAELSTPFVNLRWALYLLGYKESKLYLYNGFVMLGSFFFVRVAMVPFYYYVLCVTTYRHLGRLPVWMWVVCWTSSLGLDIINAFWFHKMFRGAYKMLRKRAEDSEKTRNRIKGE